ncbi:PLDc N-terminal domain-containing protein [Microbacterium sp. SORGH_AS_0888]|uniref:PLDc N-terminal domain-containing protein n=1 Tax=Microbacterium sp. SORGH_AS_0888 TaxID=3041791 RepID=UPI00277E3000|nr:PLDc N-terminal domain-containing protein [Microbacterium sp. SORGH_AS_0888]MDQ1129175.1 hypothetical protein [Microbacterium sp. SORGH_AS_0888]
MPVVLSLIVLVLMVVAIIDIITRDEGMVRYMPKVVWILLVVLLPFIGSVLWFVLGREWPARSVTRPSPPPFAPWASEPAPPPTRDTRTTEQQLADLEREIEEERLRAELARRRAQRDEDA